MILDIVENSLSPVATPIQNSKYSPTKIVKVDNNQKTTSNFEASASDVD